MLSPSGLARMITLFLVLILSCCIINGGLTLAKISLLMRTIIFLSCILAIAAEELQGSTALISISVWTTVGYMSRSALSDRFGDNSKSKELELL